MRALRRQLGAARTRTANWVRKAADRASPLRTSVRLLGLAGDDLLQAIARGKAVDGPVAVVVAHPDDETIGIGGRLHCFKDLTLIHVTDGAPAKEAARPKGFADRAHYTATRFKELDRALACLGARGAQRKQWDFVDGQLAWSVTDLIGSLLPELKGKAAVVTHAYEGGHPDHDCCALAVQAACATLERDGAAPARLEFTGYHSHRGQRRVAALWPHPGVSTAVVRLTPAEQRAKAAAMAAFQSQSWIQSVFPTHREVYRLAPTYDFMRAPDPGVWLYDTFGWEMKGAIWLDLVNGQLR
jgi:N-acetylglucosamine malate deacetylase 2